MLDLKSLIPWGEKDALPAKRGRQIDPFVSFRNEVDRLFDNFLSGFNGGSELLPRTTDWRGIGPLLDVSDKDNELVVSAELPGLDDKDFEVTLSGDVLTIRGEKKYEHEENEGERHYVERSYGGFSRSVRLPFEAGEQDVKADFDKGVLTVRIAKPEIAKNKVKQIEVKAH